MKHTVYKQKRMPLINRKKFSQVKFLENFYGRPIEHLLPILNTLLRPRSLLMRQIRSDANTDNTILTILIDYVHKTNTIQLFYKYYKYFNYYLFNSIFSIVN